MKHAKLNLHSNHSLPFCRQLETSDDWGVLSSDEKTKKNVIFKLELQMQAKARSLEASFEDLVRISFIIVVTLSPSTNHIVNPV